MEEIYVSSSCVKNERIGQSVLELARAGFNKIELSGGTQPYRTMVEDLKNLQKEWNLVHMSANIEVQALRIVQEALNNIRKHSEAHNVRILLRSDPNGNCMIMIEDDGIGISTESSDDKIDHYGLNIMSERAKQIDGDVRIESEPGEGTQIILQFKYQTSPGFSSIPVDINPGIKRVIT